MIQSPYLTKISWPANSEIPDRFPFNVPVLSAPGLQIGFLKPVTVLVGENGSGKSTILEAIAANVGFASQGGSRNHNYARNDNEPAEELAKQLRFSWKKRVSRGFFFRAESFFNFASFLESEAEDVGDVAYAPYGGKSLKERSHGEAFLTFFAERPDYEAIYILDEPEAALSPQRQLMLMEIIHKLAVLGDAQVIVATHSPILSAMPFAELLSLEDGIIRERSYDTTEHYKLYRRFIEAPDTLFRHMFQDER